MTEITIKDGKTVISIVINNGEITVNEPEQKEPYNIDEGFMIPNDRAANIDDNHAEIQSKQTDAFVHQFAEDLKKSPIHGEAIPNLVTEDVLDAVESAAEDMEDSDA